ncbi:MAG: peroxiredoxin [Polyangiales bacterium]
MTPTPAITVGSEAPDFELPSSELSPNEKPGLKIRLSDYRGKKNVVLAFFPLAFSPVCTSENVCFEKTFASFHAQGNTQVLGVSVDSAWALAAFKRELGLSYPLLADFNPRGELARRYGLYYEESGFTARATVIVGKDGRVKFVKVQQIPDPRDSREIASFLETLT